MFPALQVIDDVHYSMRASMYSRYLLDPVGCVDRGAVVLDLDRPGWHRLVNTSTLDMNSPVACVWGQLYGYWTTGMDKHPRMDIFAHGICGNPALLRDAWMDAITARRLADHEGDIAATTKETVNA
jgi:hypothetical protein